MRSAIAITLGFALLASAGFVAALAGDADSERRTATSPQRVEHERGPRATHLLVGSGRRSRIAVAESFCAAPNGEPIALACGSGVGAPRGAALRVRPGAAIPLRFGTAVRHLWVRYAEETGNGRVVALTYSSPVRGSQRDGRRWTIAMPRDPSLRKKRLVAVVSVAYRDPISLDVRGRQTKPFTEVFAEFAVPLRLGG